MWAVASACYLELPWINHSGSQEGDLALPCTRTGTKGQSAAHKDTCRHTGTSSVSHWLQPPGCGECAEAGPLPWSCTVLCPGPREPGPEGHPRHIRKMIQQCRSCGSTWLPTLTFRDQWLQPRFCLRILGKFFLWQSLTQKLMRKEILRNLVPA